MERFGLRDDQWDRIKDILPGREGHVGGTAADNRLVVEAVLYRFRTGIPWRDLPARFGYWKSVHQRFGRWAKTASATSLSASSIKLSTSAPLRPATTNSPEIFSPQCNWSRLSSCSTEGRP